MKIILVMLVCLGCGVFFGTTLFLAEVALENVVDRVQFKRKIKKGEF